MSMTRYPMYATILGNIINIAINYVLIFGKLGFPELGVVGAAYGTLISRIIMVIYLWYLLKGKKATRDFVTNIKIFVLSKAMFKKTIALGTPSAMQMFFEVGIFTAAVWLSGVLVKNPQAANQIAINLSSMTFMVATGLSVASMIRVGNQKGLKNYIDLRRIAYSTFLLGILFAVCFALLFLVFHNELPKLYVDMKDAKNLLDNTAVVDTASTLLIAAAIFQLSDSMQVLVLGALRGLQDVKIPTLITFISYWVIGFPVSWYFGQESVLGSFGIWLGLLAGLTTAAILLYFRFNYLTKKLILSHH